MKTAEEIQREYYTAIATIYDQMHVQEGDEHEVALKYISSFLDMLEVRSILDVGCGKGRGVKRLLGRHPAARVHGVEPVAALVRQAFTRNGVPRDRITCGVGEALPFADGSFDAVCSFALLHHVPRPKAVIAEMMRVARKAIFLSDSNRFGQGHMLVRIFKLALYKLGLWSVANYIKTAGKGYTITEGDGLAYSYSLFDSCHHLAKWAKRIVLIPTSSEKVTSWHHPLLTASSVLLCALKEE